jgi:hypothetical protein
MAVEIMATIELARKKSKAKFRSSGEPPLLVSIPTAQHDLGGVHRGTIGKLVRQGKLERVHIGRRAMITTRSIRALAAGE